MQNRNGLSERGFGPTRRWAAPGHYSADKVCDTVVVKL